MKNDFDGHDNTHYNNLYCYISGPAVDVTTSMRPGHEDWFYNNMYTVVGAGLPTYDLIARNTTVMPVVYNNQIFTQNGEATAARMPLSNVYYLRWHLAEGFGAHRLGQGQARDEVVTDALHLKCNVGPLRVTARLVSILIDQ